MSIIQAVNIPTAWQNADHDCALFVYRGDLEHPHAPGNKWHKLKYHLHAAKQAKAHYLATFGGPYSNHLHAFANTLANTSLPGIAVVRGELQPRLTATLRDVADAGIELWPCTRKDYRLAQRSELVAYINALYQGVYWLPEGGGGILGAKGCRDWAADIDYLDHECDAWLVSSGTGTTAAGLLAADKTPHLHVVSALKGAEAQAEDILSLASLVSDPVLDSASLRHKMTFHSDAHEGGYAKQSQALEAFMRFFASANPELPLDPVYGCKTVFHVVKKIHAGEWPHRRTLFIHTGGLQGWRGYRDTLNPYIASPPDSEK
ncbi:1-aminocyclopropane-1-carboxylate deaminase/D-cysteine desulfhydrase [Marinomonas pollencensis]|uniref:1-aminocyclopropane-1-carboxylate deaminase n=1 Tax=Marinomonas pollencensis TaxID=491954 RepID=A0A3E0DV13_9GAMM|nr:cysteine desulfhydrase [Marinomonas pollencensis]REG85499.1 1-aminocyclopropane-1-carboxylate deaminase [Marinomonas pollencensis]